MPAHNEEACLPGTLRAIHEAAGAVGQTYEIVVVNDASTDATAEVAEKNGARVVSVNHRQIAATRNSGGRAAKGERIFFVDADTRPNARAVAAGMRRMDKGAVGGGAPVWFDKNEQVPLYVWILAVISVAGTALAGFAGGAFLFCTKAAFLATGGFDERLYWAEEGAFCLAMKREGRFVGLWTPVLTSGRRFRTMTSGQILSVVGRALVFPKRTFTRRASVEKVWYDSNRANDNRMPNSAAARISNGLGLLFMLMLISGPLWNFVPESLCPPSSLLWHIRRVDGIFLSHIGLILWLVAAILFVNLLRQKRLAGSLQTVLLIAFCVWQAWGATQVVIWVWGTVYQWLA